MILMGCSLIIRRRSWVGNECFRLVVDDVRDVDAAGKGDSMGEVWEVE